MPADNHVIPQTDEPASPRPSDVSLIVPVGGDAAGFDRCLGSLSRLEPPPGEIIVVVDGIDAPFAPAVEAIGAVFVELATSRGPAAARNAGAKAARGDVLFFVDSDVEVAPGSVGRVAKLLSEDGGLAAVIGSYDDQPADPGFLSQYRNLLHHYVHQHSNTEASTFWGACGAVRRSVFTEVGGFDEGYPVPAVEDIELGSRMRRSGHRIRLVKDLQVKHLKKWNLGDMVSTDLLRRAAPWTEVMLHDGGLINDLNVKTTDRLSVVLAVILACALPVVLVWPAALVIAAICASLLVVLNADLYRFYARSRGISFCLAAILWHWIYLLICAVGFKLGLARFIAKRMRQ